MTFYPSRDLVSVWPTVSRDPKIGVNKCISSYILLKFWFRIILMIKDIIVAFVSGNAVKLCLRLWVIMLITRICT